MKPDNHRNNFDAIRLFAAFLVIYGHQLQMRGVPVPVPFGVPISKTGLDIFFSLSGYLITDSWIRDPRLPAFLAKRLLRILPALIVLVLLTVFVFGPLTTILPLAAYFTSRDTALYLTNAVMILHGPLPGVFTVDADRTVNGSLWSLLPEFLCYLTVPILWRLSRFTRVFALAILSVGVSATGFQLVRHNHAAWLLSIDLRFMLLEMSFFLAGSLWRVLDRDTNQPYRLDWLVLVCALWVFLQLVDGALALIVAPFLLSYIVVAFGRSRTAGIDRASRYGDLSYALYLYAFPIQQWLIDRHAPHPLPLALLATTAMAFLSWHLVERPALRFKPGRRTPHAV